MLHLIPEIERLSRPAEADHAAHFGFRFGNRGTHTSRTLMLQELGQVLAFVPSNATAADYVTAIVEDNVADKKTAATRRITSQRLRELYSLDPTTPLFSALRYLWDRDEDGRPQLALLCALARDPMLRASSPTVLSLNRGEELPRQQLVARVSEIAGNRLNERIADKTARNIASSWTQTGHLRGRVRKIRQQVMPTPGAITFALLLGFWLGLRGSRLFESFWCVAVDGSVDTVQRIASDAKRLGYIDMKRAGEVSEITFGDWAKVR